MTRPVSRDYLSFNPFNATGHVYTHETFFSTTREDTAYLRDQQKMSNCISQEPHTFSKKIFLIKIAI